MNGVEPTSIVVSHRCRSVRRQHLASDFASRTHICGVNQRDHKAESIGRDNSAAVFIGSSGHKHLAQASFFAVR